jgi:hypothetical protein
LAPEYPAAAAVSLALSSFDAEHLEIERRTARGPDGPSTVTIRSYLPAGTSFQSMKWLIGADAPSSSMSLLR